MPVEIKICGLMTPEALDVALEAGADLVGFVFFPPSPRSLSFEAARAMGARVRGRARKVALSVDADDDFLAAFDRGAQTRHAAIAWQGDAGARDGAAQSFSGCRS